MEPQNVAIEFATKRMAIVIDKFRFSKVFKALIQLNWKYLGHYQIVEDTWARPESGFATMYAYIQDQLKKDNCNVFLNQKVQKINAEKKNVETASGNIVGYDYLLSTQSIEATARMVDLPFNGELNHRLLCSLFFQIPDEAIEDCFVLFNFSDIGKWKRTTFHSNYYNRTHTNKNNLSHYFVVESMPDDSQVEDINMVELLRQDFVSSFRGTKWESTFSKSKLVGHNILRNAYPVLDLKFDRSEVLAFKERLKSKDIFLVGRQGEFDHISSSDASANAVGAITEIITIENEL